MSDASYEAALRAADALFALPDPGKSASTMTMEAFSREPDPWAKAPASATMQSPPEAGAIGASSAATDHGDDRSVASHGRILQAIESPGEDRFAALEAERAPKRRGRKPGSKNKPKPGRGDDWTESLQFTTIPPVERAAPPLFAMSSDAADDDEADVSPADDEAASTGPSLHDLPVMAARVRNDRFGWKRAGLRPGERWKRRLPKSAR